MVKDGNENVIATGYITGETATATDAIVGACTFSWNVEDVPDADFYSIEVGNRGAGTQSKAELEAAGWTLALSLGD